MDNLKYYILKKEIRQGFDNSPLPLHAKVSILRELLMEYEIQYNKKVEEEYKTFQEQQAQSEGQ